MRTAAKAEALEEAASSPIPTAEQIALRALHPEATKNLPLASIYAKRICHDLRAHGLLSEGAPTEEQVKAEAWDEGRLVGLTHNRQENPYRKELE